MKGYISKYERAVRLAKNMYGQSLTDWQMKNVVRSFFIEKLLPGATITSESIEGKTYVTVKKINGSKHTFESKF